MKLLLTMNLPYMRVHGGANKSNRGLAEGLAAKGHRLCVVVPALATPSPITHQQHRAELAAEGIQIRSSDVVDRFRVNDVEVHAVLDPARLRAYLSDQIRAFQPDWVLVSSEDQSQNLLEAALGICPRQVIYLAHTPQMFPFGPASLYPGQRRTALVGQAAALVTVSTFVASYIKQWANLDAYVDHPHQFGAGPFPDLGCFDQGYVLLMNPCAVKGMPIFLALAQALPEVSFAALPGYGTTSADRAALAALPNMTMLENHRELDAVLGQTRVLLMPSLWLEGFGAAVVEAMLRGIPVLASDYGGLAEAKLGTDYLLPIRPIARFEERLDERMLPIPIIPAQDIAPWHDTLGQLLGDRELYERQSAAARMAAREYVARLDLAPFEELLARLTPQPDVPDILQREQDARPEPNQTVQLPRQIAHLSNEQRALLMLQLRERARTGSGTSISSIPSVPRDGVLPLSFAQQRLWFLDQLQPGNAAYNVPLAVRLAGSLNVAALEQALHALVQRHEVLRTTFSIVDGQPVQVIAPTLFPTIALIDLQAQAQADQETAVQQHARGEFQQPFDLGCGPLLRITLLRLGPDQHVMLCTLHHIVADGWSMDILVRELVALYIAASAGHPAGLSELPIQYADYAVWQRQRLQGKILDRQLAYWRRQLDGLLPLQLPTDRPRSPLPSFRGATRAFAIPLAVSRRLTELCQQEGVTPFMALLAAFQLLLHRYNGQDDIAVGTVVANRRHAETEGLIGFFLNTLVLRTDLSGNPTFMRLLQRVRQVCLDAYDHQDLPFERLVEELQPERDLSRQPLFQVMFILQNTAESAIELPGLTLAPVVVDDELAKFDLTLALSESANGLVGMVEYRTDLFEPATIERMLAHFQILLESIGTDSEQRCGDLAILTSGERQQILVDWNATQTDYPHDQCIHDLFVAQVARSPDAIAAVCGEQQLTYAALDARANRLAQRLQVLGVQPDVPVGVFLERSLDLPLGLLGILKAGGAYLPLDPSYPATRLAFMLEDAQVPVLITQERLRAQLPASQAQVLLLDADSALIEREPAVQPATTVGPQNLVYLIYTSGSTGRPKGALLDHRGRVNNFTDFNRRFTIGAADRLLALSSLSFDMSAYDILGTLMAGGAIILPEPADARDPARWAELLIAQHITIWHSVPALLEMLVDYVGQQPDRQPAVLRLVLLGGDWIPVTLPERLKALVEGVQVISLGGATEVSMDSTIYTIEARDPSWTSIPYGRPMANQRCYVLDTYQQPVPIGIAGELHLAGVGLGRGYLNCPDLTAQKFVPSPIREEAGTRLYKTGDLARYRPDGSLELLGRIDYQVKIRGWRIELGEVEAMLRKHPALNEVIVVARPDATGQKQLVAYLVCGSADAIDVKDVRSFLKNQLPAYMIPSAFVVLDSLPLTANGKLDRRALTAPDPSRTELQQTYQAPRNATELRLVQIWEELLPIRPIGIADSFFDLGGHSLLVVGLMTQVQQVFGHTLPVALFFAEPTIERLAQVLRQQQANWSPSPLVPLQRDGSRQPFFCVHPVGGVVLCYMELARHLGPDQPFYGLQSVGLETDQAPLTSVEEMAAQYIQALRQVQPHGPYQLGGWSMGGVVAFEMAQQLCQQGELVELLALIDAAVPEPEDEAQYDDAHMLAALIGQDYLPMPFEEFRRLVPTEQVRCVLEMGRQAGILLPDDDAAQILRWQRVLQANYLAVMRYAPQPYPGRIAMFRSSAGSGDATRGWSAFSAYPIDVSISPGDHLHMIRAPYVQVLAQQLRQCMGQHKVAEVQA